MKKINSLLILIGCLLLTNCQQELLTPQTQQEKNEAIIRGKWKFVAYIDMNYDTTTSANLCFADDSFELRENHTGVISQGTCIQFPDKPKDIEFKWNFISTDVVDIGTDTVKLTIFNDSVLQFKRTSPTFLEYHWKR